MAPNFYWLQIGRICFRRNRSINFTMAAKINGNHGVFIAQAFDVPASSALNESSVKQHNRWTTACNIIGYARMILGFDKTRLSHSESFCARPLRRLKTRNRL